MDYQAAIFTPGLQFSSARIAGFISRQGELFDGEPLLLPAISEMPTGVPRLVLLSKSGGLRLQASGERADLFWTQVGTASYDLAEFLQLALDLFRQYLEVTRGVVARVATVVKRVQPCPNPGPVVVSHFCRDELIRGPLKRPEEFEVHAHKIFRLAGRYDVNSWLRCKTGLMTAPSNGRVIIVEQDFNTLADRQQEFSLDELAAFYAVVPDGMDEVMALYFPGGPDA